MKINVTLHTRQSPLQGHLTILKLVCDTAEHYSEEYDDWNSAYSGTAAVNGRVLAIQVQLHSFLEA